MILTFSVVETVVVVVVEVIVVDRSNIIEILISCRTCMNVFDRSLRPYCSTVARWHL